MALEKILQSAKKSIGKGFIYTLMAATSFGVVACGGETPQPTGNDAGISNYDTGSNKDTGAGYDGGVQQDTGSGENKAPVLKLKYAFHVEDWIGEVHDGDITTIPFNKYEGYISFYSCDSYDPDGKIIEMKIYYDYNDGEKESFDMLAGGGCSSSGEGRDKPHTTEVTLTAKDNDGAESKLHATFKIE